VVNCTGKNTLRRKGGDNKGQPTSWAVVWVMPVTVALVPGSLAERNRDRHLIDENNIPSARVQGGDSYNTRRPVVNVETRRAGWMKWLKWRSAQ